VLAARPHELRSSENAGLKPGRYKRLSPRPTFKKAKVKIRTRLLLTRKLCLRWGEGCGTQKGKSRSLVIVGTKARRRCSEDAGWKPALRKT